MKGVVKKNKQSHSSFRKRYTTFTLLRFQVQSGQQKALGFQVVHVIINCSILTTLHYTATFKKFKDSK